MNTVIEQEETPQQAEWRIEREARQARAEHAAEVGAAVLVEELTAQFGGRVLAQASGGSYVRIWFGVEVYSGTTPQSERWVGVEVSASFSGWNEEGLSHLELSPERMTRTGRRVRGGFYSPDVNLSVDRGEGAITCSSGPLLNGGEGPGRMAMFTGCLQIAERVLARVEAGEFS